MKDYNLSDNTVTLSVEEYTDLVTNAGQLRVLRTHGVDNWIGYSDAMHDFMRGDTKLSFNELDAFALLLLQDETASAYARQIAVQWLQQELNFSNHEMEHVGEWVAITRDLEEQLMRIYREDRKE